MVKGPEHVQYRWIRAACVRVHSVSLSTTDEFMFEYSLVMFLAHYLQQFYTYVVSMHVISVVWENALYVQ